MALRPIELRRRGNTTNLPDHIYADSKQKISSCFTQSGDVYNGMTREEIEKYMPLILGTPVSDVNFSREVKEYFKNLSIIVPTVGVVIEAGVSDSGHPESVLDYVKYLFVKSHPQVAATAEEVRSKYNYKFYIFDPKREQTKTFDILEVRKKAYKEFLKLDDGDKRIGQLLQLYGQNPSNMDTQQQLIYLEDKANNDSQLFFSKITDKNLEMLSFIEECLSAQILRKIGNPVYNGDDKLGDDTAEAVVYLKDAKNSSIMVTLRARLQEYQKTAR